MIGNLYLHKAICGALFVFRMKVPETSVPIMENTIRHIIFCTPRFLRYTTPLPLLNTIKHLLLNTWRHILFFVKARCSMWYQQDGLHGGLRCFWLYVYDFIGHFIYDLDSTIFFDSSGNFLTDTPAFNSLCFDITNAVKHIRICRFMGCSLKWKTGLVCRSLFDILNVCSSL